MSVLGGALITVGVLLILLAAVGILRLPDVYSRLNSATKAASLGIVCVLMGTAVLMPSPSNWLKLGLAAIIQLLTAPIGAQAVVRAAYRAGTPLWPGTQFDDLDDDQVELSPTSALTDMRNAGPSPDALVVGDSRDDEDG